jgi:hypothetical protein
MDENTLFFSIKPISLSEYANRKTGKKRKPCDLLTAAKHNLRQLPGEQWNGKFDPKRSHLNIIMAGPKNATEVQAQADARWAGAGVGPPKRKDFTQAIEALFSLPSENAVPDTSAYFQACVDWLVDAMGLPVLSAVLHLDQGEAHIHVLTLPLRDGVRVGRKLIDDRAAINRLRDSFFEQVAGPAGLRRQGAKLYGAAKKRAVAVVLAECEAQGVPDAIGPLWPFLEAGIKHEPLDAMQAMGIPIGAIRPGAADVPPKPIGFADSPADAVREGPEERKQSCVGFHLAPTKPASTQTSKPPSAPPASSRPSPPEPDDELVRERDGDRPAEDWCFDSGDWVVRPSPRPRTQRVAADQFVSDALAALPSRHARH